MSIFAPRSLHSLIENILYAQSIEDERVLITEELASMRTLVRDCLDRWKPRLIAKLLYLGTLGYDTAWGQMEAIRLMAHERVSYKRIGYLTVAHMFDETNERIVLLTATIQRDLQNPVTAVQRLALALLANICSGEMGQSLVSDVIKLHTSTDPIVQKGVGMACVRILRKCPELTEEIRPIVAPFLNHTYHCVVISGVLIALEMLRIDPSLSKPWHSFSSSFTKVLKIFFEGRPTEEFHFGVYNDHFLQIRLLQILAALRVQSDELDEVLSAIVTGVDTQKNSSRSLLLSTASAIGETAKKPSLRSLAFNQVGRLLSATHANTLYSALSMFSRILYSNSTIIDRSSSDSQVLQRYKSQVVHCLDHKDPSIRRRALDVITALVDETNIESLIPEIMNYLKLADRDFRTQLVAKIFTSVQRFAPSVQWNFDTTLKLLKDSGNYVGNDVITAFCKLIGRHAEMREHVLGELSGALRSDVDTQPLIQVASWALGEFLEEPSDVPDIIVKLLSMPQAAADTKGYLLTALAKLAVRFRQADAVRPVLEQFAGDNHLEIQQRAGELLRVLANHVLSPQILAPVEIEEGELPEASASAPVPAGATELLDLDLGAPKPPAAPAPSQPAAAPQAAPVPTAAAPPRPPPPKEPDAPPGAVEALRTPDYVVYFQVQRNANNPRQFAIRSTVHGLGEIPLTKFVIQYGVPPGWGIMAQPPSSAVLEPKGGRPIQQVMVLESRGVNPLAMVTQTSYMYRTQPIKETGRINPIFN
jgi:hypothetical protein